MVFCNRFNCHNNDDGVCESYENISLDENGTCTDFAESYSEDYECEEDEVDSGWKM